MAGQYILGAAGAVSAYIFGNFYLRKKATPLSLEMPPPKLEGPGGLNILPLISAVLDSLPSSIRENMNIKVRSFCPLLFFQGKNLVYKSGFH